MLATLHNTRRKYFIFRNYRLLPSQHVFFILQRQQAASEIHRSLGMLTLSDGGGSLAVIMTVSFQLENWI